MSTIKSLFLLIFALLLTIGSSQSIEVNMTCSGNFAPNGIQLNTTSTLTVTLVKLTTNINVPANQLTVEVRWGDGYLGNTPPTGTWANLFTWTYIPAPGYTFGGWYGINSSAITEFAGTLEFGVTGNKVILNSSTQVQVQLSPPYADPVPGDNSIFAGLTVNAMMPLNLLKFTGRSNKCQDILLEWETIDELNNDFIEIQRSTNAKDFSSIGKAKGYNHEGKNNYSFLDNQNLLPNTRYYYRLRQVDFSGEENLHKVIDVFNQCEGESSSIIVYPNPAVDKINIDFQGFNDEALEINIINHLGSIVKTLKLSTNKLNELSIIDLPSGVYQIQLANNHTNLSAKFIKIE
jgi:hypothetical protein